jgi:hypothetical protein
MSSSEKLHLFTSSRSEMTAARLEATLVTGRALRHASCRSSSQWMLRSCIATFAASLSALAASPSSAVLCQVQWQGWLRLNSVVICRNKHVYK